MLRQTVEASTATSPSFKFVLPLPSRRAKQQPWLEAIEVWLGWPRGGAQR